MIPKIKLSENTEKVTNPGDKTIFRIYEKESGKLKADLICLVGETFNPEKKLKLFDPIETWKKTTLPGGTYTMKDLLVPIFKDGKCVYDSPSVMDIRAYSMRDLDTLWDECRRLVNPHKVYVDLSSKLYDLKCELLDRFEEESDSEEIQK